MIKVIFINPIPYFNQSKYLDNKYKIRKFLFWCFYKWNYKIFGITTSKGCRFLGVEVSIEL